MTSEEVIATMTSIFRDVLDDEDLSLARDTTASDIEEWDSLSHITIIVELERAFSLRFTSAQIQGFANVGDICDAVSQLKD